MLKVKVIDLEHFQNLCNKHAIKLIFITEGCFEQSLK